MHRKKKWRLLAIVGLALSACTIEVTAPEYADLSYAHLAPINLAASNIDIKVDYVAPGRPPNVEHLFPRVPAKVMARWAKDRLRSVGGDMLVRVRIQQAGVVEVPLKSAGGIKATFTTEQSERYDGVAEIQIEIIAPSGKQLAMVQSRAVRSRTVPEDISVNDRERVWFEMTEAMMNDLNTSLDRQVREHFKPYLR